MQSLYFFRWKGTTDVISDDGIIHHCHKYSCHISHIYDYKLNIFIKDLGGRIVVDVKQQIREQVLKLANIKMLKHFYPTFVSKNLKVSYELVEEVLEEMAKEGLIQRKYQLICPNDTCFRELDVVENKNDFKEEYMCSFCGEEIEEIYPEYIREIYSGKK
jgi:hypothetical protein